jgi:acetate kinase
VETILALNAGSSSVKFAVYETQTPEPVVLLRGLLDRHAGDTEFIMKDAAGKRLQDNKLKLSEPNADLAETLLKRIESMLGGRNLSAVGHRIVHGGSDFSAPVLIDAEVIRRLEQLTPMAPLHQPECLEPARSILSLRPELSQVACFDTAFHHDLAPIYRRFALPLTLETKGIRRYGFHGLSFEYVVRKIKRPDLRLVVAHLGSGCSICAIHNGKSVNTTMSFTPVDGLMMATRSGAVDPGLVLYLQQAQGMGLGEIEDLLYRKSGLLGVSGVSADMRTLLASADPNAKAAVDQFCARIAEQIAVMAMAMNGMDLLVFTGGIGENSAEIRRDICARLQWLGVQGSGDSAGGHATAAAGVEVRAMSTDEEIIIAIQTIATMS